MRRSASNLKSRVPCAGVALATPMESVMRSSTCGRIAIGLPRTELTLDTRIVVTESVGRVVALRVDSAREVLKLDVEKHQPAPSIVSERSSGLVNAVHPLGKRLLLLIDLPKLLGENSHDLQPRALPANDGSNKQLPS